MILCQFWVTVIVEWMKFMFIDIKKYVVSFAVWIEVNGNMWNNFDDDDV